MRKKRTGTYGGISTFTLDVIRDTRRSLASTVFEIAEALKFIYCFLFVSEVRNPLR